MIVAALSGGLGNQMFQYAAAKAAALARHQPLLIDLSWYRDNPQRLYELEVFSINPKIAGDREMYNFRQLRSSKVRILLYKTVLGYSILQERGLSYEGIADRITRHTLLKGYWQSEKYFEPFSSEIRKDFTFRNNSNGINRELATEIQMSNSVSIHVRRGDYISDPKTNQYHGVCDLTYYRSAIAFIQNRIDHPSYFIFSDDPDWAANSFDFLGSKKIIRHNSNCACEDMRLMTFCKHNIIANSSFSWWGAWLNSHSNKIVIGPKRWFASHEAENVDIMPSNWIAI